MPKVGNKKFAYSKEGIDKAKRYARKKKQSISKKLILLSFLLKDKDTFFKLQNN